MCFVSSRYLEQPFALRFLIPAIHPPLIRVQAKQTRTNNLFKRGRPTTFRLSFDMPRVMTYVPA
jgi:hypothetical protein